MRGPGGPQRSGWGRREAELLLGSFGQDGGPVPTLGEGQGGGRSVCSLASGQLPVEGGLTGPWQKGEEIKGPRASWHHAAHISAKPAAFIFSSLLRRPSPVTVYN